MCLLATIYQPESGIDLPCISVPRSQPMSAEASQVAFIDALERLARSPETVRSPFVNVRMSRALLEALDAEVLRRRAESPGLNVTRSDVIREALVRVVSAKDVRVVSNPVTK